MTKARVVALAATLALVGCGHSMDGPTPTITKVSPSVVCNALDTTVTLTGTNFVPVPEQTLQKQSVLILPTVTLTDAAGVQTVIDTASVTWMSGTSMTFIIHASLNLDPGTYDVQVTNPTGKSGVAHGALTIVPPPQLISIKPTEMCDMLTTTITLSGQNFRDDPTTAPLTVTIGTTPPTVLSEAAGQVHFVDSMTVTVDVPAGLPDGVYDVTIQNADGCKSTLMGALTIAPPPTITSLMPASAWNGQDTTVTVTGTGFRMTPTVAIAAAGGMSINLAVTFVDAQHVTVVVPKGTAAGTYTLTLTNPDGCSATATLTVTSTPPITVTGVISPFGCSSQGTPITISGTFFESTPTAKLVGAATAGGDLGLKNVAFVSSTKLTAIVPMGGKIGGAYPLTVTNPDGSSATMMMAFTITDLCPPIIDNVQPSQVADDFTGSITVTGSNFRSDAKVVLVNQSNQEVMFPNVTMLTVTGSTQISFNIDASTTKMTDGIYLVRVKEADAAPTAGTGTMEWGDYSLFIVTNPASKFQGAMMAKMLPMGRRGLGVVGGQLNNAARFLYAVAGDNGTTTLADGLVAALDFFGNIGDAGWVTLRRSAGAVTAVTATTTDASNVLGGGSGVGRTGVGAVLCDQATCGNWVYIVGGTKTITNTAALGAPFTPSTPTTEVWRAHVMDPADAPQNVTATGGIGGSLAAGTYYYKVATLLGANTPYYHSTNPSETIASDEQVATVAASGSVTLTWTAPTTVTTGNITGYRIYRSAMANGTSQSEVFLADVSGAATLTYTDMGTATAGMAHPLTIGMLSEWDHNAADDLKIARAYPGATIAVAGGKPYLYVVGGASTASVIEKTYDWSPLATGSTAPNAFTTGTNQMSVGRWSLFAAGVTGPASVTNGTAWIVAGAGADSTATTPTLLEQALISATDGSLGAWTVLNHDMNNPNWDFPTAAKSYGAFGFYYGVLFDVGGGMGANGAFDTHDTFSPLVWNATASRMDLGPNMPTSSLTSNSDSGLGALQIAWPGTTLTSGYFWIVGGMTPSTTASNIVYQGAQ